MRRIRVHDHGGPDSLTLERVPVPEPGPGQVRVQIEAVGLNHLDLWVRQGVPGHRFPLPLVPGSDGAGRVETGPRAGERVAIAPNTTAGAIRGEQIDGTLAESILVPAEDLLPVPDDLSLVDAAAIPLSALTAWQMLRKARASEGERVLVLGGTSGVGQYAIQIARLLGCHVVATARTEAKRQACVALGAHEVVDTESDFHRLRPRFQVVVEHVGAVTWDRSVQALDWGGRLVTCGATTGAEARVDLRVLFFKQLELIGSTMGTREDLHAMWAEVMAGRIRPLVAASYPLESLAEAHAALESGVAGKVVVTLPGGG
ncbi:MAG: zinc-binding dehydrogenase [Proteobacteria bacterium]|nr:zinc-binding dehydrogenase [Pseudomonadota bacterium]MCP4921858.1 zinc-binding dehydrogenase [Pseudomonadota bacterium]